VGSNLAKGDGSIRAIKICSTPSFGGQVQPSAPCHKNLQHAEYDTDIMLAIFKDTFCQLPALLLDVSSATT
jgi:hypothetical protein